MEPTMLFMVGKENIITCLPYFISPANGAQPKRTQTILNELSVAFPNISRSCLTSRTPMRS
jgi:hypothetical protein